MSTVNYSATVELAKKINPAAIDVDDFDDVIDNLIQYHPAVAVSARGWLEVTITLPATGLAQAAGTALAVAATATGHDPIAVEVMTETEQNARLGWTDDAQASELVSVTEAAGLLGVTRQAILDRVRRNTLQATKIGRGYAIPRSALDAAAAKEPA